jgi:hypothetical protein
MLCIQFYPVQPWCYLFWDLIGDYNFSGYLWSRSIFRGISHLSIYYVTNVNIVGFDTAVFMQLRELGPRSEPLAARFQHEV